MAAPAPTRTQPKENFAHRPFYWCGLAATAAALTAVHHPAGGAPWLVAGVVLLLLGPAAALIRRQGACLMLLSVGAVWASAGLMLRPPPLPVPAGEPVQISGAITAVLNGGGGFRRILMDVTEIDAGGRRWNCRIPCGLTGHLRASPGDWVTVSGRFEAPGEPSYPGARSPRLDWLRHGVHWIFRPRGSRPQIMGEAIPSRQNRQLTWIRERSASWFGSTMPRDAALVSGAVLIGSEPEQDPEWEKIRQQFLRAGLLHLLVVSGAQVSLVAAAFIWLGWRLFRYRLLIWPLVIPLLLGYHALTGGDSSITRATWLGAFIVAGLCLLRPPDLLNLLGAAALVMLLIQPATVLDLGAALSFTAVWSILTLGESLRETWSGPPDPTGAPLKRFGRAVWAAAAVCIAAAAGTGLLTALYFHRFSWTSPAANLLAAPISLLLLPLSFLHALFGLVGFNLLGAPIALLCRLLLGLADSLAGWPGAASHVFSPPLAASIVLLGLIGISRHIRRRAPQALLLCAMLVILWPSLYLEAPPPSEPSACWLDLPHRPILLLAGSDGSRCIAGRAPSDAGATALETALLALRIRRVDVALLSGSGRYDAPAGRTIRMPPRGNLRLSVGRTWISARAAGSAWLADWQEGEARAAAGGDLLQAGRLLQAQPPGSLLSFDRSWEKPDLTLALIAVAEPAVLLSSDRGGAAAAPFRAMAAGAGVQLFSEGSRRFRWRGAWVQKSN